MGNLQIHNFLNMQKPILSLITLLLSFCAAFGQTADTQELTEAEKAQQMAIYEQDMKELKAFMEKYAEFSAALTRRDQERVKNSVPELYILMEAEIEQGKKRFGIANPRKEDGKEDAIRDYISTPDNWNSHATWLNREQTTFDEVNGYEFDVTKADAQETIQKKAQIRSFYSMMEAEILIQRDELNMCCPGKMGSVEKAPGK